MAKGYKTGGRKKGTQNRLTGTIKEMLHAALKNELEILPSTLERLDPKERIETIMKILPYIMPKADSKIDDKYSRPGILKEKHDFVLNLFNQMKNGNKDI